ncbi:SPOR domain-containing protein [Leptobacterium flavescens]|uniref:SPOR domain-containing protein n=1 Tax=Leptobacterium flavescens TaxID=472055 RepID=A0A6P0UQL2_9FLAO|nr:SPOR domain-containing protein [Leptobacterium flavescens]NER12686.1 SPOR domain-containing protein [Leptobacterium flavescens]
MRFLAAGKLLALCILTGFFSMNLKAQDSLNIQLNQEKKEGVITIDQDQRIERLLAAKKRIKKAYFTIQIYSGTGRTGLEGAKEAESSFKTQFYGWPCDISFETPNYKVRVGKFRTRLEADKYLMEIKKKYPSAFILIP